MFKPKKSFVEEHPTTLLLIGGGLLAGTLAARQFVEPSTVRSRHTLDTQGANGSSRVMTRKALAVFAATLLARSATGYLHWRAGKSARRQGQRLSGGERDGQTGDLDEHTVVELRKMAAEQDIQGRSSMKKDELIEALVEPDAT